MKQFIKVADKTLIKKMKAAGFQQVGKENDYVIFLNNTQASLNFSEEDKTKIITTNMLCF